MAEFSRLVITNKGQALLAKMIAGIGNIRFTKVSSSDAYTDEALEELTALSEVKQTSLISSVTRMNEVSIKVEASFTNTGMTAGYYMRMLGLYAVDPDEGEILYAVTREISGNCYLPAYNGITVSGVNIQLVTTVGNAESASLEVDPAAVATRADLERHNTDETAHSELFARLKRRVVATRLRDPNKLDYGVGGGGDSTGVALITADYTGNAEVTVLLNGKEYDGKNISRDAENAPNGTIIIKEEK